MEITTYKATAKVAPAIKRVAAYARVSVEKETAEHSFQAQVDYYREYISKNPRWKFVSVYADDAISGTKENRPGFQKMLEDCRANRIDLIITKTVSRFARNTVLLIKTLNELKQYGVDVYFETQNMYASDPTVEFALNLMGLFAEQEARSVSQNQIWRIKKKFERGETTVGKVLGYRLHDGQLLIVPDEAQIVRRIFDLYLSGYGYRKIAKTLYKEGVKPIYSDKWVESSVREILTNITYKGDLLLQKTYRENYLTKKKIYNHGEQASYYVENAHEPIISPEVFDKVQAEMESRAKAYGDNNPPKGYYKTHLFCDLIHCGCCGSTYGYKKLSHKSSPHTYVWRCHIYDRLGKTACPDSRQIPEHILIQKTREVLNCSGELTREYLQEKIKQITAMPNNCLIYLLADGSEKTVYWQDRSRKESWTPEMKEAARQKAIKTRAERRQK